MNNFIPTLAGTAILAAIALLPPSGVSVRPAAASEGTFLDSVKRKDQPLAMRTVSSVEPIIEETVLAKEQYQGGRFEVLARKRYIERFKCSNCHTGKDASVNNGAALTHGDVVIEHGREGSGLSCVDCHHPAERDYLEDKKGRKIDFDHSYQLCGQCHFRQKRDWVAGAHGKRVDHWAGERVVYNCTTCHNPHSPRFERRFPATYSVPLE